jgi:PAS domain S-box-containing protein
MTDNFFVDIIGSAILEYCGDIVMILDPHCKIVLLNSLAGTTLGVSRNSVIGQNLFSLCADRKIKLSFVEEDLIYIKNFGPKSTAGYIVSAKGEKKPFAWKHVFLDMASKGEGCFLIFGRDTSELEEFKEDVALTTLYLNTLLESLPEYIYWKDSNFVYKGCNKHVSDYLGLPSPKSIVGKTDQDFNWPPERVKNLYAIDRSILETGIPNSIEEIIPQFDGTLKTMLSSKSALKDEKGDIIGIIGISVDITSFKKMEQLLIENERQKTRLEEQEGFRQVVDQVVHDIRSPLASLAIMIKYFESDIPEKARITLRSVATSITEIANNLLSQYKHGENDFDGEEPRSLMVSLALQQSLSEKEHQYKELPVKLSYQYAPETAFAFIKASSLSFSRMISNIINNAVESLDGKDGRVNLGLMLKDKNIIISIKDNGKGMPEDVRHKIMNNLVVTAGKKDGNGIGYTQIRETLKKNKGKLNIDSRIGKGTEITLTFPTIKTPEWVAKNIVFYKGDVVIVLDDDESIHHAWDIRFKSLFPGITVKHFTQGSETINFIITYPEKERIFLLTDFELINQEANGIEVIKETGIQRAVLVTSHHANLVVRNLAIKEGITILPKPLAPEVPIEINADRRLGKIEMVHVHENIKIQDKAKKNDHDVAKSIAQDDKNEFVFIDDDKSLINSLAMLFKGRGKNVDTYLSPTHFLKNLANYHKEAKIFMDNDFKNSITGIELAEQLHQKGFKNLYLFSGKDLPENDIPNYLEVISKTNIDELLSYID